MLAVVQWDEPLQVTLLLGIFLVMAAFGIRLARMIHIPRVVGYLVLGLTFRIIFERYGGISADVSGPFGEAIELVNIIKSLALCLIMFAIGTTFDTGHIKAIRGHIWKLALSEIFCVFLAVFLGVLLVSREDRIIQAVFLGIAAIATAPAATLMVLRQYGAKGPMTDHILAMTGLNNIVSIVLFYIAFLVFAELGPEAGGLYAERMDHGLIMGIIYASIGSALIGCVLGLVMSLVKSSLTRFETVLIYFGIMLTVSAAAKLLGLNHLIICLFMGLIYINFSIQPHQLLEELEFVTAPIYALFFILAGFNLAIGELWHVGLIGVVFLIMRALGKMAGANLGVRWIGPRHLVPRYLGTAMLCQAGVAIGLGKYLVEHCPDPLAASINTVILASVVVFELTGPLATKWAVVRAGEVKAVTLLARPSSSLREMGTVVARLRKAVSTPGTKKALPDNRELTARMIMRTNFPTLTESAKMAEVLHFVEHSKLNHFFIVDADGRLTGTIDFSDLRNLVFNPVMAQFLTAYDMANTAPPMITTDLPLKEILDFFHEHDVGSLPVVESMENRKLLGVVEQRDVLRALHVDEESEKERGH